MGLLWELNAGLGADDVPNRKYRHPDDLGTDLVAAGGTGHEIVIKSGIYRAKAGIWFRDFINWQDCFIHWDGVGEKPIFQGVIIDNVGASGWALVSGSSTVWKKVMADTPTQVAKRVFRDCSDNGGSAVGSVLVGDAIRVVSDTTLDNNITDEATICAALSADFPCFLSNDAATLGRATYIWTGSAVIDPPTYYNGIGVIQTGTGTTRGRTSPSRFGMRNASGMKFGLVPADPSTTRCSQGFEIWGTSADGFGATSTAANSTGLRAGDIEVRHWARRGSYWKCDAPANAWVDVQCYDFVVDRMASELELDTTTNSPNDHGAEGIDINSSCSNVWFHRPYTACGSHGALTLTAGKPSDLIVNSGFRNFTVWIEEYETDARALTQSFTDINCGFFGGVIYNQPVRSQHRGSGKISAVTWINPRDSVSQPTGGAGQTVLYFSALAGNSDGIPDGLSTHDDKPVDLTVEYCTVIGSQVGFIRMFATVGNDGAETLDANSVKVRHNLVQIVDPARLFIEQYGGGVINEQIVEDNHVEIAGAAPMAEVLGVSTAMVGLSTSGYARNTGGPVRSTRQQSPFATARPVRLGLPA